MNINSMFSSFSTGTNNALSSFIGQSLGGRSTGSGISGLAGIVGNYAALKNGSYGKLMKAYYAKDSVSSTKKNNTTVGKKDTTDVLESLQSSSTSKSKNTTSTAKADKTDKTSADAAKKLVNSASALDKLTYKPENIDKIADSVEAFVTDYNSALKASSDSKVSAVKRNGDWMASDTKSNAKMLASVGIKINEDNTLSFDKAALKEADLTTVKNMFDGTSSYAHNVANRASRIYAEAASAGAVTSSYTNTGSYANPITGTMFNGIM